MERYSGEGRRERHDEVAREVVGTNPHLIIAVSNPLVLIFKGLTNAIPIIGVMADPVAYGVVANLARPGGNVTGVSVDAGLETWAKRLQVMQEVIPTAAKVGYLNLRSSWDLAQGRFVQDSARRLGISLSGPRSNTRFKKANIGACWERWRKSVWMALSSVT